MAPDSRLHRPCSPRDSKLKNKTPSKKCEVHARSLRQGDSRASPLIGADQFGFGEDVTFHRIHQLLFRGFGLAAGYLIQRVQLKVVMMRGVAPPQATPDMRYNPRILAELLAPVPVFEIQFLGPNPARPSALKKSQKKMKKVLADILA